MTKVEAVKSYKEANESFIKDCKQRKDSVMLREDWNQYTDCLHRDGIITDWQVNNWPNPF